MKIKNYLAIAMLLSTTSHTAFATELPSLTAESPKQTYPKIPAPSSTPQPTTTGAVSLPTVTPTDALPLLPRDLQIAERIRVAASFLLMGGSFLHFLIAPKDKTKWVASDSKDQSKYSNAPVSETKPLYTLKPAELNNAALQEASVEFTYVLSAWQKFKNFFTGSTPLMNAIAQKVTDSGGHILSDELKTVRDSVTGQIKIFDKESESIQRILAATNSEAPARLKALQVADNATFVTHRLPLTAEQSFVLTPQKDVNALKLTIPTTGTNIALTITTTVGAILGGYFYGNPLTVEDMTKNPTSGEAVKLGVQLAADIATIITTLGLWLVPSSKFYMPNWLKAPIRFTQKHPGVGLPLLLLAGSDLYIRLRLLYLQTKDQSPKSSTQKIA
jgi:hypothetical protein